MNARLCRIAGAWLATAALPLAAGAADPPIRADAGAALAAAATASTQACPGDAALTPLERRLLARYDEDRRMLVRFVWLNRAVYQLDRVGTLQWAESYRRTHPAC